MFGGHSQVSKQAHLGTITKLAATKTAVVQHGSTNNGMSVCVQYLLHIASMLSYVSISSSQVGTNYPGVERHAADFQHHNLLTTAPAYKHQVMSYRQNQQRIGWTY